MMVNKVLKLDKVTLLEELELIKILNRWGYECKVSSKELGDVYTICNFRGVLYIVDEDGEYDVLDLTTLFPHLTHVKTYEKVDLEYDFEELTIEEYELDDLLGISQVDYRRVDDMIVYKEGKDCVIVKGHDKLILEIENIWSILEGDVSFEYYLKPTDNNEASKEVDDGNVVVNANPGTPETLYDGIT